MNARVWKVAPFLFGSGLCALVYQTAWQRELRLIFGASTAASAAVLAIFMAGLGLGGALLGGRADKHRRPLELYGNLELLIALSAAITPALVWLARQVYVALGGTVTLGMFGGSVVRLVLSALLLAVPTILMGGTLPAAARAAETPEDVRRRALAVLYGVNTLGAVAGAALSTFFLFEVFGTQTTLWLACLLNALVAIGARVASRSLPEQQPHAQEQATPAATPEAQASTVAPPPRHFVLGAAASVGFAFLLMELVWYRMMSPLLGGSTFTFGLILIVALLGIGLGGAAYSAWGKSRPATVRGFALTCLVEALLIAVPFALGDQLAFVALMLRSLQAFGFAGLVLSWTAVASLVILPAAFVSGVQFPLLIALLGRGQENVGKQVGQAYLWNTGGSILGSLAGGFGLLPLLTAPGTWRLVVALLLVLGFAAMVVSLRQERQLGGLFMPAAAGALAVLMITATGPTAVWRHEAIGAGRARIDGYTLNGLREWMSTRQRVTRWEYEGVESSVGLSVTDGMSFIVNGKSDGNTISDASTQVMSGLVGLLLHPNPRKGLVIGLGTGSSGGWMGALPEMERVDVVEIEPAILDVARHSSQVNMNVLENPKVHTFIGDAREVLLASRETYDVIVSEPSNPYRAGISSLFTRDFYQAVKKRMAPGALLIQWVQGYEIDATTLKSAYATLTSEFKSVDTWQTNAGDLLLIATETPIQYDFDRMRARMGQDPFRKASLVAWETEELEGVLSRFIGSDGLARKLAEGQEDLINTDDLSFMEFAVARTVGRNEMATPLGVLRNASLGLNTSRPALSTGTIDWERVEVLRAVISRSSSGKLFSPPRNPSPAATSRREFIELAQRGREKLALQHWRESGWQPKGLVELSMVALVLAQAGDEAALPFLEQLRPLALMETEALHGVLRLRQGRHTEATASFEKAYAELQREPWGQRRVVALLMASTLELARKEPSLGKRLFTLMEKPFSGFAVEEQREVMLIRLAQLLDWRGLCQQVLAPYEQTPRWEQGFLLRRADCYQENKSPLAERAMADLAEFVANEPPVLWQEEARGEEAPEPRAPGSEGRSPEPVSQDKVQ